VDSSAPLTYLSARVSAPTYRKDAWPLTWLKASELLGIRDDPPSIVKIAGYYSPVHTSPTDSHFAGLNLLGSDFINAYDVFIRHDSGSGGSRKAKLYFGDHWDNIEKPKL
jgi:hypothetical protein